MLFRSDKPVVVTDVGGLPEVVTNNKTGYIIPPCDSISLSNAVIDFFTQNRAADFSSNIQKESYRFSWTHMVEKIQALL